MKKLLKRDNLIYAIFFLIALVAVARYLGYMLNGFAASTVVNAFNEYRDFPSVRISYAIMNGINPYTKEGMASYNVPMLNLYSGLNPLLAALLAKATRISIMWAYRLLNLVYIAGSTYALTRIMCEHNKKHVGVKVMFSFMMAVTSATIYTVAGFCLRPDAMGFCVYALLLMYLSREKKNVFMMSLLSILLFFTKQTMLVMVFPIFVWLIIYERSTAFKYMFTCVAGGAISLLVLEQVLPLYITSTVVGQYFSSSKDIFAHAIENFMLYVDAYKYLIIADVIMIVLGIILGRKSFVGLRHMTRVQKYITLLFLNLISAVAALCFVGRNGIDGYKYCKEMLTPSLAIMGIYFIELIPDERHVAKTVSLHVATFLMAASTLMLSRAFTMPIYTHENIQSYRELSKKLAEYETDEVYLGTAATALALENDDMMQNGWFTDGHMVCFVNECEFPIEYEDEKYQYMKSQNADYIYYVNEMVKDGDFQVLCLDKNEEIIDKSNLSKHYVETEHYNLVMDMGDWDVTLWEKKS